MSRSTSSRADGAKALAPAIGVPLLPRLFFSFGFYGVDRERINEPNKSR